MPSLNEKRAFIQVAVIKLACRPFMVSAQRAAFSDREHTYTYDSAAECVAEATRLWDALYPDDKSNKGTNEHGIQEKV